MTDITATPLSQVRPQTVRWLWEPFLPRGKLVLLDGDPGVGKSLLTIDLAARLSRGGPLPTGMPAGRPHTILLLNAEDDAADTTRPAEAAGADLERVVVVASSDRVPLSLSADFPILASLVQAHRPDLVVIDPVTAFLGAEIATGSDQSVRRVLAQLTALADRSDSTILLVRHLRKKDAGKALYRGLGSIGFAAAVRTVLLAAPHPDDPARGVLAAAKSNVAAALPSLGYRIRGDEPGRAVVEWTGPVEVDANALGRLTAHLRPRDQASEWLRAELASGPRKAADLLAAAAAANIPERTLRRAKADLHIETHQVRINGTRQWYWSDPAVPWPKDAPFKKPDPFELPPLDPLELL